MVQHRANMKVSVCFLVALALVGVALAKPFNENNGAKMLDDILEKMKSEKGRNRGPERQNMGSAEGANDAGSTPQDNAGEDRGDGPPPLQQDKNDRVSRGRQMGNNRKEELEEIVEELKEKYGPKKGKAREEEKSGDDRVRPTGPPPEEADEDVNGPPPPPQDDTDGGPNNRVSRGRQRGKKPKEGLEEIFEELKEKYGPKKGKARKEEKSGDDRVRPTGPPPEEADEDVNGPPPPPQDDTDGGPNNRVSRGRQRGKKPKEELEEIFEELKEKYGPKKGKARKEEKSGDDRVRPTGPPPEEADEDVNGPPPPPQDDTDGGPNNRVSRGRQRKAKLDEELEELIAEMEGENVRPTRLPQQ